MEKNRLASAYRTAAVLAAFSRGTKEADSVGHRSQVAQVYCIKEEARLGPPAVEPPQPLRRAEGLWDLFRWGGTKRRERQEARVRAQTASDVEVSSSKWLHNNPNGPLISHFALPRLENRESGGPWNA